MDEIKRYEMVAKIVCGEAWQDLDEDDSGDWVRYDDHAACVAELEKQVKAMRPVVEAAVVWHQSNENWAEVGLVKALITYLAAQPKEKWDGKERRVVASFRRIMFRRIIDGVLCWDDGMQWRKDRRGANKEVRDGSPT